MKIILNARKVLEDVKTRIILYFDDAEAGAPQDPLLDVVRLHPGRSVKFIKVTMLVGLFSTGLIALGVVSFLTAWWGKCNVCNRPLRWWLVVHTLLQLVQLPVRCVFLFRLQHVTDGEPGIHDCVRRVTCSRAWRTSKIVSMITYMWFVLGLIWIINSAYCPECPGLYRLSIGVLSVSTARLLITLAFFYAMFPSDLHRADPKQPKPAMQSLIDDLPIIDCTEELLPTYCNSPCAVCLCDYEVGDMLRPLPCKHVFHHRCINKWLQRNGVCPLCMQNVQHSNKTAEKSKSA
jgi:hypothetical protein